MKKCKAIIIGITLLLLFCICIEQTTEDVTSSSILASSEESSHPDSTDLIEKQEEFAAMRADAFLLPHALDEAADIALYCDTFYELPLSQEKVDLKRLIENGQNGISWRTVEIDEMSYDDLYSFYLSYIVFDDFPNADFTSAINRIVKDAICFSYDHYEETNKTYTACGSRYFNMNGASATVLFSSPELVGLKIMILAGDSGKYSIIKYLYFNPTTGERYRLQNFIELSPSFVYEYAILPQQISEHDMELIIKLIDQEGIDRLYDMLSAEYERLYKVPSVDGEIRLPQEWNEFWNLDMVYWFVVLYKDFYNEVDYKSVSHYSWIEDGTVNIKSYFYYGGGDSEVSIPFAELEPYLYTND